jgi:hypothetical protein
MPKPDPNASDWTDLDLLTVSEATERLDEELAAVRAEIAALTAAPHPNRGQLIAAEQRLVATGRVRSRAEVAATPGPPD